MKTIRLMAVLLILSPGAAHAVDHVLYAPADIRVQCACEISQLRHAQFDAAVTRWVDFHETWNMMDHGQVIERRWTAHFSDNSTGLIEQNIYVADNIAPQWIKGEPRILWKEGWLEVPEFADNCGGRVNVEYRDAMLPGKGFDRIFTVTDGSGNSATFIQEIRYSHPITAGDHSNGLVVSFSRDKVVNSDCHVTYTRTDMMANERGFTGVEIHHYIEEDSNPPLVVLEPAIERPADDFEDFYISCSEEGIIMDYEDYWILENHSLERTYRVADRCGNEVVLVQQITLKHANVAPVADGAAKQSLLLWPNPAVSEISAGLRLSADGDYYFELVTAGGQRLALSTTQRGIAGTEVSYRFDLTGLPSGTYLIVLHQGGDTQSGTFVVEN